MTNWRLAHGLEKLRSQVNAGQLATFKKLAPRMAVAGDNDCWPWTGGIRSNGYGTFAVKRDDRWTQTTAHRASYETFVCDIPDGFEVDHLCRNRSCVNPAHLEAVTLLENRRRRNLHKTHCVNGHEYTPSTTRLKGDSDGYFSRACRICERAARQRWEDSRRAA